MLLLQCIAVLLLTGQVLCQYEQNASPPSVAPPHTYEDEPKQIQVEARIPSVPVAPAVIPAARKPATPQSCSGDVLFVVDATGSVRGIFEQHIRFVLDVVKGLSVSRSGSHVGVVLFASAKKHKLKIPLRAHTDEQKLVKEITALPFFSGVTAIGAALEEAHKALSSRRTDRLTNVVVVTDGFSYDDVSAPAAQLHALPNVRTVAVTVGDSFRMSELETIAGSPTRVFKKDSTDDVISMLKSCDTDQPTVALSNDSEARQEEVAVPTKIAKPSREQIRKLAKSAKHDTAPISVNAGAKTCPLDLVLVFDASGSMEKHFQVQLETAARLVDSLTMAEGHTQVAALKYAGKRKCKKLFDFGRYKDNASLRQSIMSTRFIGGTTATNEALITAAKQLQSARRHDAKQVVIVFTDGFSMDDVNEGAAALRSNGATVFALGMDTFVNMDEMKMIAGSSSRAVTHDNYPAFEKEFNILVHSC